jgi:hypothetical protein
MKSSRSEGSIFEQAGVFTISRSPTRASVESRRSSACGPVSMQGTAAHRYVLVFIEEAIHDATLHL